MAESEISQRSVGPDPPGHDDTTPLDEQIRTAELSLARLLEMGNRFDGKCPLILGLDTAMLGILAGVAASVKQWHVDIAVPIILALVLLGLSFIFVHSGNYPRTKGPARSLLYFGIVGKLQLEEYRRAFLSMTQEQYLSDLLTQCHRNSEILDAKYLHLRLAYTCMLLSLTPWALSLYLIRVAAQP